jgi:Mitochondrial carrier protein
VSSSYVEVLSGLNAGFISSSLLFPLDTLKTRLQANRMDNRSLLEALLAIRTRSGLTDLYRGFSVGIFASTVAWGEYFYLYEKSKCFVQHLNPSSTYKLTSLDYLTCSFLSGLIVQLTLSPLWVIKLNLQLKHFESTKQAATGIVRNHGGLAGFYRGILPSIWSCFHGAIQFGFYEKFKQILTSDDASSTYLPVSKTVIATVLSKSAAVVLTAPIEVIKTRMRECSDSKRPETMREAIKVVYKELGLYGFARGVLPALLRILPSQVLMFVVYEETRKLLNSC